MGQVVNPSEGLNTVSTVNDMTKQNSDVLYETDVYYKTLFKKYFSNDFDGGTLYFLKTVL